MIILKGLGSYNPVNLLIYIALCIILWLSPLLSNQASSIYIDSDPMPAYEWLQTLIMTKEWFLLSKIGALVLVMLQGIFLIGILNQFNLIGTRSYLPGIIFILLTSNVPEYQLLHPILLANTLLLLAWNLLLNAETKPDSMGAYFNSSFLIGLATLFYPNYIYFLLVFIISTSLNRVPGIREVGMLLLGTIMVWYIYLSIFYLTTNQIETSGISTDLSFSLKEMTSMKPALILFFIYFGLLLLLSSAYSTRLISTQKVQLRRNQKFLFLWFILCILIFLFTNSSFELIYTVSIPIAILFSLYLSSTGYRWAKEIVFILLLGITFINQVYPDFNF
jgi:hypothetical protein